MTSFTVKEEDYTKQLIQTHERNVITALFEVGFLVEGEAKLRSPVDTGYMRSRYQFEVNQQAREVEIFNDAPYAEFLEMGTYKQEAQPSLRPAVEENQDRIGNIFNNKLS